MFTTWSSATSVERLAVHARDRRTRRPHDDTTMSLRRDRRVQRLVSRLVACYIVIHEARNIDTSAR